MIYTVLDAWRDVKKIFAERVLILQKRLQSPLFFPFNNYAELALKVSPSSRYRDTKKSGFPWSRWVT